jgi:hypothetical protein
MWRGAGPSLCALLPRDRRSGRVPVCRPDIEQFHVFTVFPPLPHSSLSRGPPGLPIISQKKQESNRGRISTAPRPADIAPEPGARTASPFAAGMS